MKSILVATLLLLVAGCDYFKMPQQAEVVDPTPPPVPPAVIAIGSDPASCGKAYIYAVADAFELHAKNLDAGMLETDSAKIVKKTLVDAPAKSFNPLMKALQDVPADHVTCRPSGGLSQVQQRAALSRDIAKKLRGGIR